jgi:hypothetical protein
MQKTYGHAFQDRIIDAACNQYDGTTGWIRVYMDTDRFPHESILLFVEYSEQSGVIPGNWCPLAEKKRAYGSIE